MTKALCGVMVAVSMAGMVFAQDKAESQPPGANQHSSGLTASPQTAPADSSQTGITIFNRASGLIGMPVMDASGKTLGKVQDLVFDLDKGQIGYVVLALSGQDQNSRLIPVPASAIKANAKKELVLNMSEAVLAAASSITNDQWPAVDTFAVGAPAAAETGHAQSSDAAKVSTPAKNQ
jgi:sporulation protein YlmC with PRC-barrel domain